MHHQKRNIHAHSLTYLEMPSATAFFNVSGMEMSCEVNAAAQGWSHTAVGQLFFNVISRVLACLLSHFSMHYSVVRHDFKKATC